MIEIQGGEAEEGRPSMLKQQFCAVAESVEERRRKTRPFHLRGAGRFPSFSGHMATTGDPLRQVHNPLWTVDRRSIIWPPHAASTVHECKCS